MKKIYWDITIQYQCASVVYKSSKNSRNLSNDPHIPNIHAISGVFLTLSLSILWVYWITTQVPTIFDLLYTTCIGPLWFVLLSLFNRFRLIWISQVCKNHCISVAYPYRNWTCTPQTRVSASDDRNDRNYIQNTKLVEKCCSLRRRVSLSKLN